MICTSRFRQVSRLARFTARQQPKGSATHVLWATNANSSRYSTTSMSHGQSTTTAAASSKGKESSSSNTKNNSSSAWLTGRNALIFGGGVTVGNLVQSELSIQDPNAKPMQYPSGMPRTCSCEAAEKKGKSDADKEETHVSLQNLTEAQQGLPAKLQHILGAENVLDGQTKNSTKTSPFLKGMRLGHGQALCIVTPRRIKHVYEILPHILDANCVILPQGQNTGLTGGSVPRQDSTDTRPVVVLSLKHLDTICAVDGGKRVLCLAGVGLASLDRFLAEHFPDRESHSVLGSTFLNPTTAAGVAFGSGGTQCFRKGPAFTERALYLKISQNKWKENVVEIVNTLGIKKLRDTPGVVAEASIFDNSVYKLDAYTESMKNGFVNKACVSDTTTPDGKAPAHDEDYRKNMCVHDGSVTRFNADTRGHECNRSEGKVIILATIHDTFPKPVRTRTFWVGFKTIDLALEFRKSVTLDNPDDLPLSAEYVDRDAFDVIDGAGRAMATVISWVGPSSSLLRNMWNAKMYIESLPFASAPIIIDKLLYTINSIFPAVLPTEVQKIGKSLDHHVAMSVGDFEDGGMNRLLERLEAFAAKHGSENVVVHECSKANELAGLNAFRFVAAPAFRTWCIGNKVQGFSVDYALPKNGGATPSLDATATKPLKRMRYSHFGCNVVHEDLAFAPGVDLHEAKYALKKTVERDHGGKLPAEHGHGTEYVATPAAQKRWKAMDPLNVLNPGVGGLPTGPSYK